MSLTKILLSLGALTALVASASDARAAQCKTDQDCGKGFSCAIAEASPPPVAKSACPAGAPCPVVDPAPPETPTPASGVCVEALCAADTDCGPAMVCHTATSQACPVATGVACAAGAECEGPFLPAPSCTTITVSTCRFKWELACNADADCGDDSFTCAPTSGTLCSGSGGGTASSGGSSASAPNIPAPSAPTCMTLPPFPGTCTPKSLSCSTDADCPAAWSCVDRLGGVQPAQGVAVGEPNPSGSTNPSTPPTAKFCMSPVGVYNGGVITGGDVGTPVDVAGAGGTGGGMTQTAGATTVPRASGSDTSAGAPSAGCALGGGAGAPSLAASLLALLGLAISRRRR